MAISTIETRNSWRTYLADGSVKRFDIPFKYLDPAHIIVRDDDTLKTIVTHYTIDEDTKTNGYPEVVFGTAPTTAHVIKIARKTPQGSVYSKNPEKEGLNARQALYMAEERQDIPVVVTFDYPQTELLAPTDIEAVCPCDGNIIWGRWITKTAITTGGAITFKVNDVAVDGLSLSILTGALVKGVVTSDQPTAGHATTRVKRGDRLQAVAASDFATAGAGVASLEIKPDP